MTTPRNAVTATIDAQNEWTSWMPVPAGAERTLTLPAPKRPLPSWCRVRPSLSGTRTIFFLAEAVALVMASGTSRALP